MSINFDDLLKRGKQSIVGTNSKEKRWGELVGGIIHMVHELNSMYPDTNKHNLKIELKSCSSCGEATFILAVKSLDNDKRPMRYHKSKWQYKDSGYFCERCKG